MRGVLLLPMLLLLPGYAIAQTDIIVVRSDIPYEFAMAQGYSHVAGVPIVATSPYSLGEEKEELLRGYLERGYRHAVILGGEKAISLEVQQNLDEMGFITRRIAEADRYGTSATFAREFYAKSGGAILVSGEDVQNLLLAERISSTTGYPMLFTRENSLPPAVADALERMEVSRVYIFRDELSGEVLKKLKGYEVLDAGEADLERGTSYYGYLLVLAIGVLAGAGGLKLYTQKRREREKLPFTLLTEDEGRIIKAIQEEGGKITQDKLPRLTGFSRPKITRLVSDLKAREILEKSAKGRTNEIKLLKEIYKKT